MLRHRGIGAFGVRLKSCRMTCEGVWGYDAVVVMSIACMTWG